MAAHNGEERQRTAADHPVAPGSSEQDDIVLYGARTCPFSQRARIAVDSKGLKYEYKETDPYKKPEDLLTHNPRGAVPTLVHNGERQTSPNPNLVSRTLTPTSLHAEKVAFSASIRMCHMQCSQGCASGPLGCSSSQDPSVTFSSGAAARCVHSMRSSECHVRFPPFRNLLRLVSWIVSTAHESPKQQWHRPF